jgi:hypothetical protein
VFEEDEDEEEDGGGYGMRSPTSTCANSANEDAVAQEKTAGQGEGGHALYPSNNI